MGKERVEEIFREIFENESLVLRPEMTAKDVAKWDSFNHINLILALEEEFGIRFSTEEMSSMANVGDLMLILQRRGANVSW